MMFMPPKPNDTSWIAHQMNYRPVFCAVVAIIITLIPVMIWGGTP